MECKKTIFVVSAAVFCIIFSGNIYNSVKSYKYRRLCDQYRESLIATETTNRELTNRIGRVAEVVEQLHETTERNVTDARGIVETVERLRTQIQELENICGGFNYNKYYEYYDSYYRNEQLME